MEVVVGWEVLGVCFQTPKVLSLWPSHLTFVSGHEMGVGTIAGLCMNPQEYRQAK
jgi:hypothetical protein